MYNLKMSPPQILLHIWQLWLGRYCTVPDWQSQASHLWQMLYQCHSHHNTKVPHDMIQIYAALLLLLVWITRWWLKVQGPPDTSKANNGGKQLKQNLWTCEAWQVWQGIDDSSFSMPLTKSCKLSIESKPSSRSSIAQLVEGIVDRRPQWPAGHVRMEVCMVEELVRSLQSMPWRTVSWLVICSGRPYPEDIGRSMWRIGVRVENSYPWHTPTPGQG